MLVSVCGSSVPGSFCSGGLLLTPHRRVMCGEFRQDGRTTAPLAYFYIGYWMDVHSFVIHSRAIINLKRLINSWTLYHNEC